jgi:hypothetical protein
VTQAECDQEYLDVLEQEHAKLARKGKPPKNPPRLPKLTRVDRSSPRWKRMRGTLTDIHGLGDIDLDDYCDRVYRLIPA